MEHNDLEKELQALKNKVDELQAKLAGNAKGQEMAISEQQSRDQHEYVRGLVRELPDAEKYALREWASSMLLLRRSEEPAWSKASQALRNTIVNKAVWPVLKKLALVVKQRAWDQQDTGGRALTAAGVVAVAVAGLSVVGLAASGVAVGFPLWVVFGNGVYLASSIYDECNLALQAKIEVKSEATPAEFDTVA